MRGIPPTRFRASTRPFATCQVTNERTSLTSPSSYFDQVPTRDLPFITDHLLSPAATSVKQFCGEFFQVVQKPSLLSFQVPSPLTPALPCGSRVILPSAANVIVYLMFCGVDEVKGWPVKKVD